MLEVNVCCHRLANMFCHLIQGLSSSQMVNLLSFPSSQQCSFLQILVAIQEAGDFNASAFITLWPHRVEKCWLEGKVLG